MAIWPFRRKTRPRGANTISTSSNPASFATNAVESAIASSPRPRSPRAHAVGEGEVLRHYDLPPKGTTARTLSRRRNHQQQRSIDRYSGDSKGGSASQFMGSVYNEYDKDEYMHGGHTEQKHGGTDSARRDVPVPNYADPTNDSAERRPSRRYGGSNEATMQDDPSQGPARADVSSPGVNNPSLTQRTLDPSNPEAHPSHYLRDEQPSAPMTELKDAVAGIGATSREHPPATETYLHQGRPVPQRQAADLRHYSSTESITALPVSFPLRTSPHLRPATHSSATSSIIPYNFHLSRTRSRNLNRSRSGNLDGDTSADGHAASRPHTALAGNDSHRGPPGSSSMFSRRKSAKQKSKKNRGPIREEEFRTMAAPLPIQRRHNTHAIPASFLGPPGHIDRSDSRKGKKASRKPLKEFGSDASLPFPESIASDVSGSDGREYTVSGLSVWAPRPKLRVAAPGGDVGGTTLVAYSLGTHGPSSRSATAEGWYGYDDAMEAAGVARTPSKRKRQQPTRDVLKASKTIDGLADELDAAGLREVMDREHRRVEKKKRAEEERIRRRMEATAVQEIRTSEEMDAGEEDNDVSFGSEDGLTTSSIRKGKSRAEGVELNAVHPYGSDTQRSSPQPSPRRDHFSTVAVPVPTESQRNRNFERQRSYPSLVGEPSPRSLAPRDLDQAVSGADMPSLQLPTRTQVRHGCGQAVTSPDQSASQLPTPTTDPDTPTSAATEVPVIGTAREVRYSHASVSAQAGSSRAASLEYGSFLRTASLRNRQDPGGLRNAWQQPHTWNSTTASDSLPPSSLRDVDAAIVAANVATPPRKQMVRRDSPASSIQSHTTDEHRRIPPITLYREDEPRTALPPPQDALTALPHPTALLVEEEPTRPAKKRRGTFLAGVASLFKRGRRTKEQPFIQEEVVAERSFTNESRERIVRQRAELTLRDLPGPIPGGLPNPPFARSKSDAIPPNLAGMSLPPDRHLAPPEPESLRTMPLVPAINEPPRITSPLVGRHASVPIASSHAAGIPVRRPSKFREDLPESGGSSRAQSPEGRDAERSANDLGLDEPTVAARLESLDALVARTRSRRGRAANQPAQGNDSEHRLSKDSSTLSPLAMLGANPLEKRGSGYSSTEAPSTVADADEEDGVLGRAGHNGSRASNPMSRSLASIDSEGSWLSGKIGGRARRSATSTVRSSTMSALSESIAPFEEDEDEREAGSVADPQQTPRLSSQATFGEDLPGETTVDEQDEGDGVMKTGAGRHPQLVHHASNVKSREGLLNEYLRGEAVRGQVGAVEDVQLATLRATLERDDSDGAQAAAGTDDITYPLRNIPFPPTIPSKGRPVDSPVPPLPTSKDLMSDSAIDSPATSTPDRFSPTSDAGTPEEPFLVGRAQSVDLGKAGQQLRHLSAGSAKLLDIRRSSEAAPGVLTDTVAGATNEAR